MDGKSGIQNALLEPHPDIILLDVTMPDMDGWTTCKEIRKHSSLDSSAILFLTSLSDMEDEAYGFTLGAVDFISKPVRYPVLLARVRTQFALKEAYHQVAKHRDQLSFERNIIKEIILRMRYQVNKLPDNIHMLVAPVEETNGDIILLEQTPDGIFNILLGDFTGHGLPAAIGGPIVEDVFIAMTRKGLPLTEIIVEMDRKLSNKLPPMIFMAACFISWSPANKSIEIYNAGMPPILHFRNSNVHEIYPSTTFPLGIDGVIRPFPVFHFVDINPGDRIALFSDGIIEAKDIKSEMFGIERLEKIVANLPRNSSELDAISSAIRHFCGDLPKTDDISVLILDV